MSKRWYGSLQNRLLENCNDPAEITVGMGATEYSYSDREPLEVISVKDQKHVTVRRLVAKRTDDNGMSECQQYEFYSDESQPSYDLVKRGGYWYTTDTMTAEDLDKFDALLAKDAAWDGDEIYFALWAGQFDHDKVRKNGKQTRYHKMNIGFGVARKYYDYSF